MALSSDVKKGMKPEELEELLNGLEKLLERTKVLYEQYFMGIQKMAPLQLHRDVERKVRELMQQQIRNTALRFRFTTLSQKFGSYSTYWKRTLREIEQGKYVRDLARVKRKADQMGEELPEELLVKLPKLVQDRIRRDRERLAERALRDAEHEIGALGTSAGDSSADDSLALHEISEVEAQSLFDEGDLDLDKVFQALTEAPAPEGTPIPGATRAVPPASESDAQDPADSPAPDAQRWEPEGGDAPAMDSWAASPEPDEAAEPAVEPPTPAESMVAQGKGRAARARGRTVTSPMGKAIAASRPPTPDASDGSDAPPVAARSVPPVAPVAAPSAAAPSAPPVFRVPLPPGAGPRPSAIPPEPPAAVPLPPVLPRTATGPQAAPAPPRTMTGQTPPVPPGPAPPVPPRTMTGQQTPVPPRTMTGQQTPVPPRTMTGQQTPVPPRTMTGQQTPPVPPRTMTGQQTRAATGEPVATPRAATPPPSPRGATPPPSPRAATPPPPPRAATARRAESAPAHPAPDLPPGMDDRECRQLYARYLKARQLVGESNDDVTYERLVSSLSKQASAIMNQHSARGVQFHVVVRGDKVVLKAKPLKPGKDE